MAKILSENQKIMPFKEIKDAYDLMQILQHELQSEIISVKYETKKGIIAYY